MNVFAIRHGQTAWGLRGRHTGTTDIPLTDDRRRLAERMRSVLVTNPFAPVLCGPRARQTGELEAAEQVGTRVDRVIARSCAVAGDIVLFAQGHALRTLAARRMRRAAGGGQHFLVFTGTICALTDYRAIPAVRPWNAPRVD